jgi:DnaJ-class molecular chaperone
MGRTPTNKNGTSWNQFYLARPIKLPVAQNFYQSLELPITAGRAEVLRRIRKLRLMTHPDKARNSPAAAAIYALIDFINDIMKEPFTRGRYDSLLAEGKLPKHGTVSTNITEIRRLLAME